jgi:mono/diheme cytochrome c family protein
MSGTFPPLAGNPVATGDPARVIHIVKDGLTGPVSVKGATYDGAMPAWGQTLSSSEIAAAITYVRSAWGNSAGGVTPAEVAATR